MLARDGVCWRTQVAIRTQTLEIEDWQKFVKGRPISIGDEDDQCNVDVFLATHVLLPYFQEADQTEKYLISADARTLELPEVFTKLALKRWSQIKSLLRTAVQSSIVEPVKSKLLNDFDSLEASGG